MQGDFIAPVMSRRAWICITSNLFKVAGVVVINVLQSYCRIYLRMLYM